MSITVRVEGLDKVARMLDPKRFERVVRRTVNKTAAKAKTAMSKEVRKTYTIKAKDFNKKVKLNRAKGRSLKAVIRAKDTRGTPLINFNPRQTKKGVTYRVKKTEGRKRLPHAFIATMPSGHTGVFKRFGPRVRIRGRAGKHQRIREQFRVDTVGMVNQEGVKAARRTVDTDMDRILTHELNFEMSKG